MSNENIMNRAINISSVDRIKSGVSKVEDFVIDFTPSLILPRDARNEIGVDKIMMTYSWHNITANYGNNTIKYSHDGSAWKTITFPDGVYSYQDIDDYIHKEMKDNKHFKVENGVDVFDINLIFVNTSFKVIIELGGSYQVDFRGDSTFCELIGFDKKLITQTEYGSRLPNITNSVDVLHINTDVISDSIVGGVRSNTLIAIPTSNLTRSNSFTISPMRVLFNEFYQTKISSIRLYVNDTIGRPVVLNGVDWFITLIIRSTPIN